MITRHDFDQAVNNNMVGDNYVSWDGVYDELAEKCEFLFATFPDHAHKALAEAMCKFQQEA